MKKIIKSLIIATFCILLSAFTINADSIADPISVGDTIYLSKIVSGFNGGPFWVGKSAGEQLFMTFCLETDEYFYPNAGYTVYNISNTAFAGGSNTNTGDPLDPRTAYLYTMFRNNSLSTLISDFSYNDHNDYISLQRAIWLIEEEISSISDSLANNLVALANYNNSGWTDIGNVRVINLGSGGNNQDQLVLVPEPATVLLLGIGLVSLAFLMRKRKRIV